jgi:hypothetical protein
MNHLKADHGKSGEMGKSRLIMGRILERLNRSWQIDHVMV